MRKRERAEDWRERAKERAAEGGNESMDLSYLDATLDEDDEEEDEEEDEDEEEEERLGRRGGGVHAGSAELAVSSAADRLLVCDGSALDGMLSEWKRASLCTRLMKLSTLEEDEERGESGGGVGGSGSDLLTVSGLFPSMFVESTHVVTAKESLRLSSLLADAAASSSLSSSFAAEAAEEDLFGVKRKKRERERDEGVISLSNRECKQIALNILSEKLAREAARCTNYLSSSFAQLEKVADQVDELMLSLLSKTVRAQPCKFCESVGCCCCCFLLIFLFLISSNLVFFFLFSKKQVSIWNFLSVTCCLSAHKQKLSVCIERSCPSCHK